MELHAIWFENVLCCFAAWWNAHSQSSILLKVIDVRMLIGNEESSSTYLPEVVPRHMSGKTRHSSLLMAVV